VIFVEKILLNDFLNYKFLSGINYSPDKKNICFVQHEANIEKNNYNSYLWIYNVEKEKYYKLTNFGKEKSFIWYDDENILFPSNRGEESKEKTIFYKININGGEAESFFEVNEIVTSIEKIDEKNFIVVCAFDLNKDKVEDKEEEENYKVFEEIPFWSNGAGYISRKRRGLCLFNIENKDLKKLTDDFASVESFDLKEKKIVFTSRTYEHKMPLTNDIFLYDIEKEDKIELSKNYNLSCGKAFFTDENSIIFTATDSKKYGLNENKKFYIQKLDSLDINCITPELDLSQWNSVGSDCRYGLGGESKIFHNGWLYFITTVVKDSHLYRVNCEGKIEKILCNSGSIDDFDISNEEIYFLGLRDLKLQEVYKFDYNKETQVTNFNSYIENKMISKPEKISFESDKDVFIDGWIMKPVDFKEGNKYPVILNIHGGPKTVYGDVYFHEMQYWANEGYVVIFCNPRGSDGRGNDFADIRGKYGTIDYDDIMNFTDYVIKNYDYIDENKMGVTGGSYGGFMTNWIIGHTDRFKTAASQRSISNWISKAMTTDIGYYFVEDQNSGNIWDDVDKLWFHSPLKYSNNAKTPTLFIHSDEDFRCYMAEAFQMFTALKYNNIESKFVLFHGENHELSRSGKPKGRIRRLKEITEWMNKYLKN
jgi:dipeptidyl aminopeptidase/acylaminoacyl peptidase